MSPQKLKINLSFFVVCLFVDLYISTFLLTRRQWYLTIVFLIFVLVSLEFFLFQVVILHIPISEQFHNINRQINAFIDHSDNKIRRPSNSSTNILQKYTKNELLHLANQSIIFAGMGRNVVSSIFNVLNSLETEIGCLFKHATILVFESHSTDGSTSIIKEWQQRAPVCNSIKKIVLNDSDYMSHYSHVEFKYSQDERYYPTYENGSVFYDHYPYDTRIVRYVKYRNFMLDTVMSLSRENKRNMQPDFDLFGLIDFDIISLDAQSILKQLFVVQTNLTKTNKQDFVGMCSNGMKGGGYFYDCFATIVDQNNQCPKYKSLYESNKKNELLYNMSLNDEMSAIDSFYEQNQLIFESNNRLNVKNRKKMPFLHSRWLWAVPRIFRTNCFILPNQYLSAKSCFGGLVFYNFQILKFAIEKNKCQYVAWVPKHYRNKKEQNLYDTMKISKYDSLIAILDKIFAQDKRLHAVCEHIPFNLCLLESGQTDGKLYVARDAKLYMGLFGNGESREQEI